MTETLGAGTSTGTEEVPAIRLRKLTKVFGDTIAVNAVDLEIRHGEFFSMLGPSGSGKTTVLRLIAGFEMPTSGTIELEGKDVTAMAPFQRDVNTVFQDYALFPHMSLVDNVAYGLRVRGCPGNSAGSGPAEALDRVQLGKFVGRKPAQLSGGQRQRVALARALVVEPKVLLLDEPLGALDLKLRQQMQLELKALQRSLGITFIFVTHDQEEALTMSDRIGVFNNGRLNRSAAPTKSRAAGRDFRGQFRRDLQHLQRRPGPAAYGRAEAVDPPRAAPHFVDRYAGAPRPAVTSAARDCYLARVRRACHPSTGAARRRPAVVVLVPGHFPAATSTAEPGGHRQLGREADRLAAGPRRHPRTPTARVPGAEITTPQRKEGSWHQERRPHALVAVVAAAALALSACGTSGGGISRLAVGRAGQDGDRRR